MRKILAFYVLSSLILLSSNSLCFAFDKEKVIFSAEKVDKSYLEGEINKKILKKYTPIKLTIKNKNEDKIFIPNKIFYKTIDNKVIKTPNSKLIYDKTKRHAIRRAFMWGIPGTILTLGFGTIPIVSVSIAHSVTTNNILEDNINKNNFTPHNIFQDQTYSTYIFIPKKYRNAESIIIKDITCETLDNFDLKAEILSEDL